MNNEWTSASNLYGFSLIIYPFDPHSGGIAGFRVYQSHLGILKVITFIVENFCIELAGLLSHYNDLEQRDPETVRKLLAKQPALWTVTYSCKGSLKMSRQTKVLSFSTAKAKKQWEKWKVLYMVSLTNLYNRMNDLHDIEHTSNCRLL